MKAQHETQRFESKPLSQQHPAAVACVIRRGVSRFRSCRWTMLEPWNRRCIVRESTRAGKTVVSGVNRGRVFGSRSHYRVGKIELVRSPCSGTRMHGRRRLLPSLPFPFSSSPLFIPSRAGPGCAAVKRRRPPDTIASRRRHDLKPLQYVTGGKYDEANAYKRTLSGRVPHRGS